MASAFCLFSLALCNLSSEPAIETADISSHLSLSGAQVVSIPRTFNSPCPQSFRYTFDGHDWFGFVTIVDPAPRGIESNIKVVLSVPLKLNSRYIGKIVLAKDQQSAVSDIENGQPLQYRVLFPDQNVIPKLFEIYYNNRIICKGVKDVGRFVTMITLEHTLTTRNSSLLTQEQAVKPVVLLPLRQPTLEDHFDDFDFECGVPDFRQHLARGLIVNGRVVSRGQFPWMAAYYHNGRGESGFICGGSLVSARIVVTAAHCIQNKKDFLRRRADEASFYLGKHNLETLRGEQNYVVSGVKQFVIHPDWNFNDDRYDADLAIAVLVRTVSFSKFVKPICLWTATESYEDLIGKKGIVAGWGKTQFNAMSTERPMWIEIGVVSETSCLRSHKAMAELTSDRTFCAGDRNDNLGPCSGDSGGGFVVRNGAKWYLRGVVSSSLFDSQLNTCDTKNYAVFTDVSSFTNWIYGHIHTFG